MGIRYEHPRDLGGDKKSEQFREAMQDFLESDKEGQAIYTLLVVAHHSLRQGNGILWQEIQEIIAEETGEINGC